MYSHMQQIKPLKSFMVMKITTGIAIITCIGTTSSVLKTKTALVRLSEKYVISYDIMKHSKADGVNGMRYIEGEDRAQITLLPDCIEDYIKEDNPVRVIDAFVDGLDIAEIGIRRAKPNETGRPPYDPRDILKLYIYGYFNKIRSSRKLRTECSRNIELFYLMNRLTPDFRTIADFRKENARALKEVFREFVKICMKMGLYQKELLAVDGSKFRAVNSKDNCYNSEVLHKKIKRIDEHITEYLSRMDEEDKTEPDTQTADPEKIQEALRELRERKGKYEEYLKELEESGETQLLTTDPEARRMHSKDGSIAATTYRRRWTTAAI